MDRSTRCGMLAALLLVAACRPSTEPGATAAPPASIAPTTTSAPAAAQAPPAPVAATPSGISPIVAPDTIGVTKAFLERSLGPSRYETPDRATYRAGGCDITVDFDGKGAVREVGIDLEPGCAFDAAALTGADRPVPVQGPMTFADFEARFGPAHYLAPCLRLCGNAYDPYVDAVVPGTRVNGVVDIAAHAVFVADAVIEASMAWQEKLTARAGEAYVMDTRFNCEREHDDIPREAFARAPVERLRFGRGLGSTDCT